MQSVTILRSVARLGVPLAVALVLAACATRSAAPVEERRPPTARPTAPPSATPAPAPAAAAPRPIEGDTRPSTYTVKRGDTLAAIALEFGLDYREVAAWNGIENPDRILVGQVIRLNPAGEGRPGAMVDAATGVTTAPLRGAPPVVEARPAGPTAAAQPASPTPRNSDTLKVSPKAVKEPYSEAMAREMAKAPVEPVVIARAEPSRAPGAPAASAVAPTTVAPPTAAPGVAPPAVVPAPAPAAPAAAAAGAAPATAEGDEDLDWVWPARGKIVTGFSDTANLKGIDIAGTTGTPVVASAAGKVVYAGSGLRGYGKLVIIKHNNKFLSAYAHNREILVKEGQQVTRGQKIAEMGNTDADQVKLHFEIRRLGKPMDPIKYLPPQG
jgi:lipoprotein NlpD